ncbi:MAG: FAD:protein FMN transferase [Candidatus Paceibacteria bacterium]
MTSPLTFEALGTTWWIEVFDEIDDKDYDELKKSVVSLVHSIETRFSRFLADSLITTLNEKRTLDSTDTDLLSLITFGKKLYESTGGIFNCLLGEHLEARGYDAAYSFIPKETPTSFPNPQTDILIKNGTILLTQGKLDLGGYGKGWTIDQVANLLKEKGIVEFLINAGGDMYGTSENGESITIYLEHPQTPDKYIGSTTIFHQGFAASSRFKRQWKHQDTTYTHIIETAQTATELESGHNTVFVKASSAVMADAFATTGLLTNQKTLLELATLHRLGLAFLNHETNSFFSNQAFTNNEDGVS